MAMEASPIGETGRAALDRAALILGAGSPQGAFSGLVVPTLELNRSYCVPAIEFNDNQDPGAAATWLQVHTVPPGELWEPKYLWIEQKSGTCTWSHLELLQPDGQKVRLTSSANTAVQYYEVPTAWLLPAGWSFQVYIDGYSSGIIRSALYYCAQAQPTPPKLPAVKQW